MKALAHITGGGLVDNVPRVIPEHLAAEIDLAAIKVPPVFRWLAGPVAAGGDAAHLQLRNRHGSGRRARSGRNVPSPCLSAHGETVTTLGRIAPRKASAVALTGRLDLDG